MLLFTPYPETKNVLVQIRPDEYNFYEFNLSSYYEQGRNLADLFPSYEYISKDLIEGAIDTPDFDIAYGEYLMNQQFFSFMNIVLPLYNDPYACVIIYIQHSPIRDLIMECIDKLIQQRYGYRSYLINELEDLYMVKDDSGFSVRGIINIQQDSERAMLAGYYGPIQIPSEDE